MYLCAAFKSLRCISPQTVEVFKTNVHDLDTATVILEELRLRFPSSKINFDLDDCDKILRVAGRNIETRQIQEHMQVSGFFCVELVD